jgi:hypothetical protein
MIRISGRRRLGPEDCFACDCDCLLLFPTMIGAYAHTKSFSDLCTRHKTWTLPNRELTVSNIQSVTQNRWTNVDMSTSRPFIGNMPVNPEQSALVVRKGARLSEHPWRYRTSSAVEIQSGCHNATAPSGIAVNMQHEASALSDVQLSLHSKVSPCKCGCKAA